MSGVSFRREACLVAILLCSLAAPTVSLRETIPFGAGNATSRAKMALPAVATGARQRISPELDPESHKKFFDKDYPDDDRPRANSKHHKFDFKHPYPVVQDSEDFEKDYVKDENSDGGEWKAQMKYDALRIKMRQQVKKVEDAKKKMDEEAEELEDAKKDEKDAEQKSDSAERAAEKSKSKLDAAEKAKSKIDGETNEEGNADGAVGDAVAEVEKEMKDLEGCKKQLAAARKRLKDLLDEKVKREKVAAVKGVEEGDAEHEADKAATDASENKAKYESAVEKERAEHAAAREAYEKELQDVKEAEKALDKAAQQLREFRRSGTDSDGGVYYEKSGAARAMFPAALVAMVAVLVA